MRILRRGIDFVSFDFDGTLAKFERLRTNFKQALEILGLSAEAFDRYLEKVKEGEPLPLDLETTPIKLCPELKYDRERHKRFIDIFYQIELDTPYESVEGALEVLDQLASQGFFLFLWTSNRRLTIIRKLKSAGFTHGRFHRLITRDGLFVKPHPEAIMPVLKGYGLLPQDGVHLGDYIADIEAARLSGMQFLGVLTGALGLAGFQRHNVESKYILGSIADLPALVEK